jgi:hypothetical protein
MSPVGFEPTIPASERPQTYALGSAATGIGINIMATKIFIPDTNKFTLDIYKYSLIWLLHISA